MGNQDGFLCCFTHLHICSIAAAKKGLLLISFDCRSSSGVFLLFCLFGRAPSENKRQLGRINRSSRSNAQPRGGILAKWGFASLNLPWESSYNKQTDSAGCFGEDHKVQRPGFKS